MKYLHSWLQEYIIDEIPKGDEFLKGVSTDAFEVEEFYEIENKIANNAKEEKDYIYDLNVLPNRAHDALSHYYMAKEVATIFNLKLKDLKLLSEEWKKDFIIKKSNEDFIKIAEPKYCSRFMGAKVNGVLVKDSPDFIKYRLEAIGQKSINNIVDITNYVQFSFNKPMHAYDADLVGGFLDCRFAKDGESMTTLDNKELSLDENTLVIADHKNVLALAGIKGGKYSGINESTKKIMVESANFNPNQVRKTSQKYNLKTDASKRFENGIADDLVEIGMIETLKLLKNYASNENTILEIGEIIDNFPKEKLNAWKYKVSVSLKEINNLLGADLSRLEVENIFKRFNFSYKYISTKDNLEEKIKEVMGKPYKNPSSMREDAPQAFTCSSLISYLYEGVYMPSLSIDKYLYTKDLGKEIKDKEDLKFGDLVFSTGDGKVYFEGIEYKKGEKVEGGVDHLGMYVGDGKILHSSRYLENGTEIESFEDFVNKKGGDGERVIAGFGRVLENLDEERFVVEIPSERLDLRIKEDIIEEVARIYGLNNIKSVLPILNKVGIRENKLNIENIIKNILLDNGFSEVMNYSLRGSGDIKIIKSVAQDKNYLRNNLANGLGEAVQKNIFNIPLLNINEIRIFEFGNCFSLNENKEEREYRSLAIAIDDGKKNKNYQELKNKIIEEIKKALNISEIKIKEYKNERQKENVFEINFDELASSLKNENIKNTDLEYKENENLKYKPFGFTPFIVRDIACWVNENINENDILETINKNISALCISINLFDKFEKEIEEDGKLLKKKSFAFRLIYQDKERTLTDEEVNIEADKIYKALKGEGFEIR